MNSPVYASPIAANGVVYVATYTRTCSPSRSRANDRFGPRGVAAAHGLGHGARPGHRPLGLLVLGRPHSVAGVPPRSAWGTTPSSRCCAARSGPPPSSSPGPATSSVGRSKARPTRRADMSPESVSLTPLYIIAGYIALTDGPGRVHAHPVPRNEQRLLRGQPLDRPVPALDERVRDHHDRLRPGRLHRQVLRPGCRRVRPDGLLVRRAALPVLLPGRHAAVGDRQAPRLRDPDPVLSRALRIQPAGHAAVPDPGRPGDPLSPDRAARSRLGGARGHAGHVPRDLRRRRGPAVADRAGHLCAVVLFYIFGGGLRGAAWAKRVPDLGLHDHGRDRVLPLVRQARRRGGRDAQEWPRSRPSTSAVRA